MKKITCLLMLIMMSEIALAADVYCTGKVENIRLSSVEELNVKFDWNADFVTLCKFNQTWKGITAATCARWLPSLQSAEYMKKSVSVRYVEPGVTQCSAIPTWSNAPASSYIGLLM